MKIKVKLFGTLPRVVPGYDGRGLLNPEMPDDATVAEMIDHLQLPADCHYCVVVNGDVKKPGDPLHPGDAVSIFIPVAGG